MPKAVTNVCTDLGPTFKELRAAIDITSVEAAEAGENVRGLGNNSPNKHFRSIEDNYIVINKVLEPSLDQVTDLPVALDSAKNDPAHDAAASLADACEKSLRKVKDYSQAALVFERAAYSRRTATAQSWGGFGIVGAITAKTTSDRERDADQARMTLDSASSDVKDASRSLKRPELEWRRVCHLAESATTGTATATGASSVTSATSAPTANAAAASPAPR